VLCATEYRDYRVPRCRLDVAVSSPSSRYSSSRRPSSTFAHDFILSCASFPSRAFESDPPVASRRRAPPLGFRSPSRHPPVESTCASFPSSLRSALGVSHALDGLLHHRHRGFVSPHSHVRDSLFRGFPRRTAARALARRCPRVVCARPLPPVARRRQKRTPAFRAFLRAEIRCDT
jgi:hypothetical protein